MNRFMWVGIGMFIFGIYLAAWAVGVHLNDWWAFPTLLLGVTAAVGGMVVFLANIRTV